MTESNDPKYLDPKELYADELEDWLHHWDDSLSVYENLYSICSQSVILPYQEIQLPIAVTYLMTSSKWAKVLPILFSWGEQGSGKTTFAILAARLHGQSYLFSPADTFASIRNALNQMKWYDPDSFQLEKDGAILCWDNIHKGVLTTDLKLYQTMLFGYNKQTARIQIASAEGNNQTFFVFCPKIISSVEPLHSFREFEELQRRLLVIRHKPIEKFFESEKNHTLLNNVDFERLDLDSISWKGFEEVFFLFWNNEENCRTYVKLRSALTRKSKKKIELPSSITSARWTITIDLIITGLLIGTWKNQTEAIEHFGKYWELVNGFGEMEKLNTLKILEEFLDYEVGSLRQANERLIAANLTPEPIKISTQKVKRFLEVKSAEGAVDIAMKTKNIAEIMRSLGFRLAGNFYIEAE